MKSYETMTPKTLRTLSETTGSASERAIMEASTKDSLPRCLFNFIKGKLKK